MTSNASSKRPKNDRALLFYRDVLGLERLHYGLWLGDEDLTMDNLKAAQTRYEDLLIDSIPESAKTVLDVGCGSGELCLRLKEKGYDVEGLSPDINQEEMFKEKVGSGFQYTRFEDFEPPRQYDCIIMSESCQYIPLDRLFVVAIKALKPGGSLIICDYFVTNQNAGILSKSGHDYAKFMETAKNSGLEIIEQRDITKETAKTLDIAMLWTDKILLGADILTAKVRAKHPTATRLIKWLFRKKIKKALDQKPLLDSEKFCAAKRYEFFIFQSEA